MAERQNPYHLRLFWSLFQYEHALENEKLIRLYPNQSVWDGQASYVKKIWQKDDPQPKTIEQYGTAVFKKFGYSNWKDFTEKESVPEALLDKIVNGTSYKSYNDYSFPKNDFDVAITNRRLELIEKLKGETAPPPHDPLPQEVVVGMGGGAPQFNDEFNRNGLKVKYVNVYGTGEYVFKKENIRCVFDREEVVLPEDLESIRIATELAEIKKAETGTNTYWNSNTAGLKSHIRSETNDEKNLLLHLTFYPSNYYRNLAMGRSLYIKSVFDSAGNLVTVKEKYLDHASWDEVVPILATAFGVALSVITKDNFLIVAKRADVGVGSWRGNYHCAMNEGLDMRDFVDGEPDLFKTAERGLAEELGIGNNEISDIRFLTFGYDTINYQWGLHGMVQVNLTAQEVMNKASNGKAKDRREYKKLHPIKFNVNEVIRFLIQNTPWTPFCKVCTIFTLIQCFGEDAVDREIASQLKS